MCYIHYRIDNSETQLLLSMILLKFSVFVLVTKVSPYTMGKRVCLCKSGGKIESILRFGSVVKIMQESQYVQQAIMKFR